jgi:hypothetical protein
MRHGDVGEDDGRGGVDLNRIQRFGHGLCGDDVRSEVRQHRPDEIADVRLVVDHQHTNAGQRRLRTGNLFFDVRRHGVGPRHRETDHLREHDLEYISDQKIEGSWAREPAIRVCDGL